MNVKLAPTSLPTTQESIVLAKAITKLFEHWNLTQEQQCTLLGLSVNSRRKLNDMAQGKNGIPAGRDAYERVGYLLSIHKALRLLYPQNKEILYGWVNMRNTMLDGRTPIEMMLEQGFIGLAKIARFLDMNRGR